MAPAINNFNPSLMLKLKKSLATIIVLALLSVATVTSCEKKADSQDTEQSGEAATDSAEHPADSTEHPADTTQTN
jgi:hypothetical protein